MDVERGELTEVVRRLSGGGTPGRWQAKKLYEPVAPATAGYQEGLEEAGWSGVAEIVELGMNTTMGARYAGSGPARLRSVGEERSVMNRRPTAETARCRAETIPFLLDHADQARRRAGAQPPRVRQKQRLRES